jgi:oligopeptide/dipeptide ABC transporter ATP-binding protein
LRAVPVPDPDVERQRARELLHGEPPSPIRPPSGCVFASRCLHVTEVCRAETPRLVRSDDGKRFVACHRFDAASRY